jgi:CBS-domain-containing membrane protein
MTLPATAEHQIARHVREAMSRDVPHARVDDTISQAARHMSELAADQLVVVDGRSHVAGVVSQQQILRFYLTYVEETELDFAAAVVAAGHETIESLLSHEEAITIRHDAPLAQAALLMSAHGLSCLPVVDRYEELKGVITTSDLLREFTRNETSGLETGFEFFEPHANRTRQRPAFVRRSNKELVIPSNHIAPEHEFAEKVLLGFDEASGRILLKFIPAGMKSENSLSIRKQGENVVIGAEAFVQHYRLLDRSTTFDVQLPDDSRYLVLVPR